VDAKTLLAELAHIADARGGMQHLRDMIYNLAITGDLTQQRAADGDADLLLQSIEQRKLELLRRKAFKRTPKLESAQLQVPVSVRLPDSWRWSRLVDVGEINPKCEADDDAAGSFVSMSGVPQIHGVDVVAETMPWREIKQGFTHFANGDVVLAKITPCFENGKAAVIKGLINSVGAGTTELHVVRPLPELIEPAYVYAFLRSPYFRVEGEANMTGTAGQKRLPTQYFATRAFPLPPLPEQRRIVAKVDELMTLCDKLEAQQRRHAELRSATRRAACDELVRTRPAGGLRSAWHRIHAGMGLWMDVPESVDDVEEALGYLGCMGVLNGFDSQANAVASDQQQRALPAGWRWTELGDLAEYITSGSRGWRAYAATKGDVFIRSQDIKHDELRFEDQAFVSLPEKAEGKRTLVREGDLLMTITGANVGKCAQMPRLGSRAYVSQHVALVRVKDVRQTPFLHAWITNAHGGRKHLARFIYGDKPGLNLPQVAGIPVPLPPQDVQDRIVQTLSHYKELCDRLAGQLGEATRLSQALAQASVAAITGVSAEEHTPMKTPRTELISNLRLSATPPAAHDAAPLAALLARHANGIAAKSLWGASGLDIDAFYRQLKVEMAQGWIVQPEVATVREVATR
jgi:type I restriction enzyme, S subunit